MTDRVHSLTVVLDRDMRTDDVEAVSNAIRALRFVADVRPEVLSVEAHMAQIRARADLTQQLWNVLHPPK